MPITPYLAHQALEPEIIETMSAAFVAACDALYLKIGADPAARSVAEKVIELAQRGIRDPDMLCKMTLKEFGLSDESASVRSAKRVRASRSRAARRALPLIAAPARPRNRHTPAPVRCGLIDLRLYDWPLYATFMCHLRRDFGGHRCVS